MTIYNEHEGKLIPVDMWSGRNPFDADRRLAMAGTGLNGTIEGYARFCQMMLNYGKFNGNRIPDTLVWEKFLNVVYQALE